VGQLGIARPHGDSKLAGLLRQANLHSLISGLRHLQRDVFQRNGGWFGRRFENLGFHRFGRRDRRDSRRRWRRGSLSLGEGLSMRPSNDPVLAAIGWTTVWSTVPLSLVFFGNGCAEAAVSRCKGNWETPGSAPVGAAGCTLRQTPFLRLGRGADSPVQAGSKFRVRNPRLHSG